MIVSFYNNFYNSKMFVFVKPSHDKYKFKTCWKNYNVNSKNIEELASRLKISE